MSLNTHHWLPFTNNNDFFKRPQLFTKAEGMYYWDQHQNKILDACSGLFCSPAGHGRSDIADAVHQQLLTLDFSPHFMRATEASFALAEILASWLPDPINHIFFCSSGSEAVDTAIKVALAYHHAAGNPQKQRFVSRERAYHGVNIGGTSLSGMMKNREAFGQGMSGVVHMRHTWLAENSFTQGQPETGAELAEDLQRFVQLYGKDNIAACFVEPIAGSTGALIPPKGYLQRLREICTDNEILLVFDEVITGFGRTGKPFASQTFDVTPDIITLAKALTNGTQPMGAVAVSETLYNTIRSQGVPGMPEFFHGYTYSAHPAACAAALATANIYQTEGLFERSKALTPLFQECIHSLADLSIVKDIRSFGLMAGIDLHSEKTPNRLGYDIQAALFDAGLHLKTTGNCAIIAPAFIARSEHLENITDILRKVFIRFS
jgi:beta-alanine--pyruvate transaminase